MESRGSLPERHSPTAPLHHLPAWRIHEHRPPFWREDVATELDFRSIPGFTARHGGCTWLRACPPLGGVENALSPKEI